MHSTLQQIIDRSLTFQRIDNKDQLNRKLEEDFRLVRLSPQEWSKFLDESIDHMSWLADREAKNSAEERRVYLNLLEFLQNLKNDLLQKGLLQTNDSRLNMSV